MNNKKKSAFTLAETLVTLMVLGIIATLTIPSVQNFASRRANAALAQKALSSISNATKDLQRENGAIRFWNLSSYEDILKMYKSKMTASGTIISSYPVKYLNGGAYDSSNMFNASTSFINSDGMLFYIQANLTGKCSISSDDLKNGCIDWGVDVNGAKGPNVIGRDIFGFYVTSDGSVYGEGGGPGVSPTTCSTGASGWGCSARVITEGSINW